MEKQVPEKRLVRLLYFLILFYSNSSIEVPQYILEAGICGNGQIAVTQPRRVAATSLAARVAEEQGVALGTRVGYAVRFNEKHEAGTKIKYLTDGMLSRELLADPLLSRYNVVIIDEAHERTLNTDVLLANLKTIQKERKASSISEKSSKNAKGKGKAQDEMGPLRIVVMSATLDAEKFSHFFHRFVNLVSCELLPLINRCKSKDPLCQRTPTSCQNLPLC